MTRQTRGFVGSVFTVAALLPAARLAAQPATPVADFKLLPGFAVERLYSVPKAEQGSWVSLTVDDKGRLITCDQYGKLFRITVPAPGASGEARVEPLAAPIGGAHGLLYAFDSLYVMVNERSPQPAGLYRLRDTNGDDRFDKIEQLRKLNRGGEHGPHAIIPSPDGKSIYVCAGNNTNLPTPPPETSRVPRVWAEDHLLGRMPDARGHARNRMAPGGWVARLTPDGKEMELICTGFRNEYDIAFHPNGELFTFDADMEWDIGAAWYRPTRVCHITSGAEFGWRNGSGKWPVYYPDSLPASVDIGPGSPTGIVFGTGTRFPAEYQRALFVADWSFGIIFAVHLAPDGASFTGTFEHFVAAAPLPVTDMVVHPKDGALYFTIGGRRTQSGLYRVTYAGDESTAPARYTTDAGVADRALRHRLEALHKPGQPDAVEKAWPYLGHADRFIRFAARIAIEHQPVASWQHRALSESNPRALIRAVVALARHGKPDAQKGIIDALGRVDFKTLDEMDKLALLRAYGLTFVRLGKPDDAMRRAVVARLDAYYPAKQTWIDRELCRLLVYLEAPGVIGRTLTLLAKAPTQEEQMHYAYCLRDVTGGWTLDQRRAYFAWFNVAAGHRGGASFGGFLENIRAAAIKTLTETDRTALAPVLAQAPQRTAKPVAAPPRPFVRKWTVDELLPAVQQTQAKADVARGRDLFAAGACYKCHRFAGEGGSSGPDLTGAGGRFNARDLLEALIEPSKVISDQYQATLFQTADGRTVVGRVANMSGDRLQIVTDMLAPGDFTSVRRGDIERMAPSTVSMMPEGLLDTLRRDEIVDLVAFLRSGANRGAAGAAE